ncbi:YdaS family helix-turn-helix protein [Chromobacterium violaceum]|uniref:YdaS family helix-turn-helix protein n=1 Tax=Chromobacterium violaceum TaxID=536 RepID=UPI00386ED8A3
MNQNLISQAIDIVGLQAIAQACGVSYQAVRKWERKNKLPRTDWTGETSYSTAIEKATGGAVTKSALLATVPPTSQE